MHNRIRRTILIILAAGGSLFLFAPGSLFAQEGGQTPLSTAPSLGFFGGRGSGPVDAKTLGLEASIPVGRNLALRAEYSAWANGGRTMCLDYVPSPSRCSVRGSAALAGIATEIPVGSQVGVFGKASGGGFARNGSGNQILKSGALSLDAGAHLHLWGGFSARMGFRSLRIFDHDYRTRFGEDLRYTMAIMGLEYRIAR